ncbi:unnamed protein product [Owenia fusiformis]|uniref:Uncharacterized protein n=1 Tax=Owenia fusiformis TaxID=6347 RepID=A0A8J1UGQ6_OWEFU|nr:unnamed protein product [Owenia fusiformis]
MDIVPYVSVYIDASWRDFLVAISKCTVSSVDRKRTEEEIQKIWTNEANSNFVLPCLSVRSALDLFLRVKSFPKGSEIIMSALNIPDMEKVIRHHGLKIVPLDVNMETMMPKYELIDCLVTDKTVGILVAPIFGRIFDLEPFVQAAQKHQICLIEDNAEAFGGFELGKLGHPKTDISLFSFGPIKFYTAFGGSVVKVRDRKVYDKMLELYESYPKQTHSEFLKKILKYSIAGILLNVPCASKTTIIICRFLGIDHKKKVVSMLRGFPSDLIQRIRYQPSNALLHMMLRRFTMFDKTDFGLSRIKGDYISERLPEGVTQVGMKAEENNYWLFPVIVDNPEEVLRHLNASGVDAYRGATQLNLMEPGNERENKWTGQFRLTNEFMMKYPTEARYIIDHVLYLPVNKMVPFHQLDKICEKLDRAITEISSKNLVPLNKSMGLQPKSKL